MCVCERERERERERVSEWEREREREGEREWVSVREREGERESEWVNSVIYLIITYEKKITGIIEFPKDDFSLENKLTCFVIP